MPIPHHNLKLPPGLYRLAPGDTERRAGLMLPGLRNSAQAWGNHHCAGELRRAIGLIESLLPVHAVQETTDPAASDGETVSSVKLTESPAAIHNAYTLKHMREIGWTDGGLLEKGWAVEVTFAARDAYAQCAANMTDALSKARQSEAEGGCKHQRKQKDIDDLHLTCTKCGDIE